MGDICLCNYANNHSRIWKDNRGKRFEIRKHPLPLPPAILSIVRSIPSLPLVWRIKRAFRSPANANFTCSRSIDRLINLYRRKRGGRLLVARLPRGAAVSQWNRILRVISGVSRRESIRPIESPRQRESERQGNSMIYIYIYTCIPERKYKNKIHQRIQLEYKKWNDETKRGSKRKNFVDIYMLCAM